MQQIIRFEDIDIHIDGPENAPTIVMIHGWPDSYRMWEPQVEALRNDYRCARFTLPGFTVGAERRAYSFEEITSSVAGIVETVSPTEPVILMLHDFGCAYGHSYTLTAPERVSSVIMFDVGDANSPELDAQLGRTAKMLRDGYQKILVAAWRRGGRGSDAVSRVMGRVLGTYADSDSIHSGMNYPYELMRSDLDLPVLGAVVAHPTFFLYGKRKPFMFHSRHWANRLKTMPDCEVAGFVAGHWLMTQRADEVNNAIAGWLANLSPQPPR